MMYLWGGLYMGMGILGIIDYHNYKVEFEKQANVKFEDYLRENELISTKIPEKEVFVNLKISKDSLKKILNPKTEVSSSSANTEDSDSLNGTDQETQNDDTIKTDTVITVRLDSFKVNRGYENSGIILNYQMSSGNAKKKFKGLDDVKAFISANNDTRNGGSTSKQDSTRYKNILKEKAIQMQAYFFKINLKCPDSENVCNYSKVLGRALNWVFLLPTIALAFVAAGAFGGIGGVIRVFADLITQNESIRKHSTERVFTLPIFGSFMGLLLYAFAQIFPNTISSNGNPISGVTLLFLCLFGGLFSINLYGWFSKRIRMLFPTNDENDENSSENVSETPETNNEDENK